MPNGVWPARGTVRMREGIPASAFSKGDLLMYDSSSSLSGMDTLFPAGADIAGVAMCDSDQSFNNKVTVAVPTADAVFWSVATAGSAFTPGHEVDFDVDGDGRPVLADSDNSVRAVVEEVQADIDGQSVQSRALIRLIRHAGNLEHS